MLLLLYHYESSLISSAEIHNLPLDPAISKFFLSSGIFSPNLPSPPVLIHQTINCQPSAQKIDLPRRCIATR